MFFQFNVLPGSGPKKIRLKSVFIWRHGGHVGDPKQRNGGHDGVPN